MKAAVLHRFGKSPRYEDFPDPTPRDGEVVIRMKAVALENFDRALARGVHYSNRQLLPKLPAILGTDGIGALEDGTLIGVGGLRAPYGAMAELVATPYQVPIPEGIDAAVAASVPSSTLTALFPLKWGAKLQPDETVLINGVTGFAGKLAVQVAKLIGAKRIVATGRNDASLRALSNLAADAVINLQQSDTKLVEALKREAGETGYGVILDFLWGRPTEALVASLVPEELSFAQHNTRLVQIGEVAGPRVSLPANALRTSGLQIIGAGGGLTIEAVTEGASQVWEWIKTGKLHADIERVPLKDIERAWKQTDIHGKRAVIMP